MEVSEGPESVTKSLVPDMLDRDLPEILKKTWGGHVFVGYQTIALMALKEDKRTGGEDYQYALKYKAKAWSLAAQQWAKPTKENAQALYIYSWFNMIVSMEISHYSKTDKQFAIEVSRALEVFAKLYKTLTPFVMEMSNDALFSRLVKFSTSLRMTEAQIEADPVVKAIYNVIKVKAGDANPIMRGDAQNLTKSAAKNWMELRVGGKDARPILFWTASGNIHAKFWKDLSVGSTLGDQHVLWWLLLANWAVACFLRGDGDAREGVWYMKGVGTKIVRAAAEILEQDGLHKEELWPAAMAQALRVLGRQW